MASTLQNVAGLADDDTDSTLPQDTPDATDEAVAGYSPRAHQRLTEMLQRLREERVGPSDSERWWSLAAALAKPVTPGQGRFGQVLGNVADTMTAYSSAQEKAKKEKDALIAKYELGLASLEDKSQLALETAKLKALAGQKPLKITQGLDENGVPYAIKSYADGTNVFEAINRDGVTIGQPTLTPPKGLAVPAAGAPAAPVAVAPAAAPGAPRTLPAPTGVTGAQLAAGPAAGGAGAGVKVGDQFVGPDGATYVKTATGQRKVAEPSMAYEAQKAAKVEEAKQGAEATVKRQAEAQTKADAARQSQMFIDDSKKLLASGDLITGFGANQRLLAARAAAAAGNADAQRRVEATETFQINAAQQVMSIVKNFGSGTSITDSDREYARRMAGGEITMNEASLKRIMNILTRANDYAQRQSRRIGAPGRPGEPEPSSEGYHYDSRGRRVTGQ